MVSVFVDTSGLFALVDEDDSHHRDAAQLFGRLPPTTELVTTNYVLVEVISLVRRRLGMAAERRLTEEILPIIRVVWVDEPSHQSAVATYRAAGRSASLVDHVSFVVMRNAGLSFAFAFDTDFERRGFRRPSPPLDAAPGRVSDVVAAYASGGGDSELVSVAEVAARAGRSSNTIQSWRRRHPDFPAPVAQLATGPVWTWPDVAEWIAIRARPRRTPRSALFESGLPNLAARAGTYLEGFGER